MSLQPFHKENFPSFWKKSAHLYKDYSEKCMTPLGWHGGGREMLVFRGPKKTYQKFSQIILHAFIYYIWLSGDKESKV